jgi:protoheme IX farnesyltransferase
VAAAVARAALPNDAIVSDSIALVKSRVMALAVFTALIGLMIAPTHFDPPLGPLPHILGLVASGA